VTYRYQPMQDLIEGFPNRKEAKRWKIREANACREKHPREWAALKHIPIGDREVVITQANLWRVA
jgi:hypothetical protein